MASLAHASSEFVGALRRGLAAYDAGDHTGAYDIFSEALEIEPDNVWALLWKGATAPTPEEASMWLQQAEALDPENEHVAAGLAWVVREQGAATDVGFGDDTGFGDDAAFDSFDSGEEFPDWLQSDDAGEFGEPAAAESSVTFVEVESTETFEWTTDEAEAPDDFGAATDFAVADDFTLADESADESADDGDLPDWLRDVQAPAATTADVPDWLRGETAETPDFAEEDLPDWLRDEGGADTESAVADAPAAGGLPDWLTVSEEPIEIDTSRRPEGSLPASSPVAEAYQAGLLAYEENRLDEAVRAFERTIQLDHSHVEAHNYLGSVYFLQGRTDDAIRAFQGALRLDQDHAESHLNLGLVFQETGQAQQAIKMFERYLQLEPESSIAGEVQGFISQLRG